MEAKKQNDRLSQIEQHYPTLSIKPIKFQRNNFSILFGNKKNCKSEHILFVTAKLNGCQKKIYNYVTNILNKQENSINTEKLICFVSGSAGCGKSYLIKVLQYSIENQSKHLHKKMFEYAPPVVTLATTAVAAIQVQYN